MIFNFNWYDLKAFAQNERQAAKLQQIYNAAISEAARLAASLKLDPNVPFSFNKFPRLKKQVEELFQQMAQQIELTINKGSADAWALANAKNDKFLEFLADKTGHKKSYLKNKYNYGVRNQEGLKAFQTRKTDGLNLSQRVWKYTSQAKNEIELAIDGALELGSSADSLSRRVKQYLNHPDKLFRRVRDKYGNLVPSKAMKIFNPGQGVYRSSHKNAMRLARTEINMAYREADHQRWSKMDFVRGIQIKLSNNPNHCPTCQKLAGVYPKTFKFVGWHPQCRCFAVPYLLDQDAFVASLLSDEPPSVDYIQDLPPQFKGWIAAHQQKLLTAISLPYFIRDNQAMFDLSSASPKVFNKEEYLKLTKTGLSPLEETKLYDFMDGYIGTSNSFAINRFLRDGQPPLKAESLETINLMDTVTARTTVKESLVAYRRDMSIGIKKLLGFNESLSLNQMQELLLSKYVGKLFLKKDFTSISVVKEMNVFEHRDVELKIRIGKGKKLFLTEHLLEREALLSRGSKFKILNSDLKDGLLSIELELI